MNKIMVLSLAFWSFFISATEHTPFISESKSLLPQQEWNREIVGGNKIIHCKFSNTAGPLSAILLAEHSYKALVAGNKAQLRKSDLMFFEVSQAGALEADINITQRGSYYFILKNDTARQSEFSLSCFN